MQIQHILVPVDFSESSKNALRAAIKLAKKANAKLTLVNALHIHTPLPHLKGGSLMDTFVMDYEVQVQENFRELATEIVELRDVPHEEDRYVSYLTDAIQSEVVAKNIDLIVMGTRSKHTLGERLLGSNSIDIIKTCQTPVIVIPESYSEFQPEVIGFASDFLQTQDLGQLKVLNAITELYASELMVFHIADEISEDEQKELNRIRQNLTSEKVSVRIVSSDSVVSGIQKFSDFHQLSLLVLMPRKHNLFEQLFVTSVTKAVAIDLTIPLLTLPE